MAGLSDTITVYAFNAKHKPQSETGSLYYGVPIRNASGTEISPARALYYEDRVILKREDTDFYKVMYVKQTRDNSANPAATGYIKIDEDNNSLAMADQKSKQRFYTYGKFEWTSLSDAIGD